MTQTHYQQTEIERLTKLYQENPKFTETQYKENQVKKGLRDENGAGVITGLTDISDVIAKKVIDGVKTQVPGELYYRGINVKTMIDNYNDELRLGFEEQLIFCFLTNCQQEMNF